MIHELATSLTLAAEKAPGEKNPLAMDVTGAATTGFERFTEQVLFGVVDVGIVAIGVALTLCFARLLRGPTYIDRAIANDTLALQIVGLVVLFTVRFGSIVTFDAVLIVAFLGFISTLAFAQFVGRRGAA